MRSLHRVLCVLFALCKIVHGQEAIVRDDVSEELDIRYAGELNHVPIGCKAVGMGNTGVVLQYQAENLFWNPAVTAFTDKYSFYVEGAKLYGGLSSLGTFSCAAPVSDGLSTALFYKAFFPDNIIAWDSLEHSFEKNQYIYPLNGYPAQGIFHNNHHCIIACIGKRFSIPVSRPSHFSLPLPIDIGTGMNIKVLWQTITPEDKVRMGMNINLDVGLLLRLGVDYDLESKAILREIVFGMSLRDFLPTKMKWLHSYEQYEEPIHGSQFFGMAYYDRSGFLFGNWTVSLAVHKSYDMTLHGGLEGEFFNMVAFRAGIAEKIVSLGAGVHYKNYSLDYTFSFDEIQYTPLRLAAGVQF